MRYSLAPNGVFWSLQGEGHLQGFQQAFIRLAGCSVGCAGCDTDYSKAESVELEDLIDRVRAVIPSTLRGDAWVWITGGEPSDLPQPKQVALIDALHAEGWNVCVATSGVKRFIPPVEWLSVSPHTLAPMQRYANELKLVDGLNGLSLHQWADAMDHRFQAMYRYVQPLSTWDGERWVEDPKSLVRCLAFLATHPDWALSQQRHHQWGVA